MVAGPVRHSEAALSSTRIRILIVEDEPLIRMMVSEQLREADYDVLEACNAEEAVVMLDTGMRFDLVISDVRMPGCMDGLGLLAYVKASRPTLPVIITSGHLQRREAEASGAIRFLAKPFPIGIVVAAVAHALERTHE